MPERKRIKLIVHIDFDPTPGVMNTEESARDCVDKVLTWQLDAYNPTVETLKETES